MKVRTKRFLSMLLLAAAASSQATGADGQSLRVAEVRVVGNRDMSREAVLAHVLTRVGHGYSDRLIRDDQRRLLRSGKFHGVIVTTDKTDKGVVVTFTISERPLVTRIELRGNKEFSDQVLAASLTFAAGGPLDTFAVEAGRKEILAKYHEKSHYFADVTIDQEALTKRNQVIYEIVEGPVVRVRKIKIEGNRHFGDLKLKSDIKSTSNPWWWIFGGGQLDMDMLKQDVAAIRRKYQDEGFLDVEVGRVVEFSDDKRNVTLTFQIRENTRYLVDRVIIQGNDVFSNAELSRKLAIRQGDYAKADEITASRQGIETSYGRLGYIDADVTMRKQYHSPVEPLPAWAQKLTEKGHEIAVVDVLFDVVEGGQFRVGRVDLRPAPIYKHDGTVTQSRIPRRELTLHPGQIYNIAAARKSEYRLRDSRIFDKASITPVGARQGVRDVIVETVEGQTGNIILGIGVHSDTGVSGNISYTEHNYDIAAWPGSWRDLTSGRAWKGAGQQFSISAQPGTRQSRYSVSWSDPSVYNMPYSLRVGAYNLSYYYDTHDEDTKGLSLGVGHRFKNDWSGELFSSTENVELRNIDSDAPADVKTLRGTTFLQGLGTSLTRDHTDSRWMPTTGDRFQVSFEQFLGDYTFETLTANYRIYQTLHVDALDRKHVLALKVAGGQIFSDAPTFKRFYGGGQNTVRGFKYRGISPRSGGGNDAIGGDFMLMAGAEYSFPLAGEVLRGVIFIDSGTVEENAPINNYRVSTGFGLQWNIKFMGSLPVRLDFGFPLAKTKEDDTRLLSFSIGWAF